MISIRILRDGSQLARHQTADLLFIWRMLENEEDFVMSSTAIATIVKLMESLPEAVQGQVLEHLRDYLDEIQDELRWDGLFKERQKQLIAAAQRAKKEIGKGDAKPLDHDHL